VRIMEEYWKKINYNTNHYHLVNRLYHPRPRFV